MTPRKGQSVIPDNEKRKVMIAIRLTEEEHAALERIAATGQLPISRYVREGISLVIEKYERTGVKTRNRG